jgi:hypothetical protein
LSAISFLSTFGGATLLDGVRDRTKVEKTLLDHAQAGWDGAPCDVDEGSLAGMAWRAGAELKEAELLRPLGLRVCTCSKGRCGEELELISDSPSEIAVFVRDHLGEWKFERHGANSLEPSQRLVLLVYH